MQVPEGVKISLLSYEDVFGDYHTGEGKLKVLKKYGPTAAATDLVLLSSAACSTFRRAPGDLSRKGRTAAYLLSIMDSSGPCWNVVDARGKLDMFIIHSTTAIIRPKLTLPPDLYEAVIENKKRGPRGTWEVDFLCYPQYVPNKKTQEELEEAFYTNKLDSNGTNRYALYCNDYDAGKYVKLYDGKSYIWMWNNYYFTTFSDGEHKAEKNVWLEVQPVSWLIDEETKTLISKRALISGINLKSSNNDNEALDDYLNNTLLVDLFLLSKIPVRKQNRVNSEIQEIKDKIDAIKRYSLSDENIDDKIDLMLKEYNSNLDKLIEREISGIKLNADQTNSKKLFDEFKTNLITILGELEEDKKKARTYFDMLDILDKCKSSTFDRHTEIYEFIGKIKNEILASPILLNKKDELSKELDEAIDAYVEKVKTYIENAKGSKEEARPLDKLIEEFRLSLTPFLMNVSRTIINRDVVGDHMKETEIAIRGLFDDANSSMITSDLLILKEDAAFIEEHGNLEEKECIKLLDNINLFASHAETLSYLKEVAFPKIHGTRVAIEDRKKRIQKINEYRLSFNNNKSQ